MFRRGWSSITVPRATAPRMAMKMRLNGMNRVSVTGSTRSMIGSPEAGANSGLPGVARMRGADPDRPPCQTVQIPR